MTVCAKNLMSRAVITARPEMSCEEIMELFSANRISGAPVINPEGVLIGVISMSDVLSFGMDIPYRQSYFEEAYLDRVLAKEGFHIEVSSESGFVSDYMSRNVYTVLPDTPIEDIAELMYRHRIHRVIVVNPSEQKPVGLVSTSDLVRAIAGRKLSVRSTESSPSKPLECVTQSA